MKNYYNVIWGQVNTQSSHKIAEIKWQYTLDLKTVISGRALTLTLGMRNMLRSHLDPVSDSISLKVWREWLLK